MRAVVQRVRSARVLVDERVVGAVDAGLLVYLGVGLGDDERALAYVLDKVLGLRVFHDDAGKMNRSLLDTGGALLVVSQFTLYGDVRSGKRPSFDAAMPPDQARALYERFVEQARARVKHVATGEFRATMLVDAQVDGPVTLLVDSAKGF